MGGDDGFYVPPQRGTSQAQIWATNSPLPGDHVAAGAFDTAMSMLNDQIGICDFGPFKELFALAAARSKISIATLPSVESLFFHTHRNWEDAGPKSGTPAIGIQLSS